MSWIATARGWTSSTCKGPPSRSVSVRPTRIRARASTIFPDRSAVGSAADKRRPRPPLVRRLPENQVKAPALILASIFAVLALAAAYAHGDHKPEHGGTVGRGDDDIVIEFVMEKGVLTLYVEDESGKPIVTKDIKGTLFLVAPQRPAQEVKLVSAGGNKFTAAGIKPGPGERLGARVTLPTGEELESVSLFSR